jgi:predicted outer membrane repeat protein
MVDMRILRGSPLPSKSFPAILQNWQTFDFTNHHFFLCSTSAGSGRRLEVEANGRELQSKANGLGGGLENHGEVEIIDSKFRMCEALVDGGAIYAGSNSTTNITESLFEMNTAGRKGGAIFSDGYVFVKQSIFEDNSATEGGTIDGDIILEGCENEGLDESKSCDAPPPNETSGGQMATVALATLASFAVFFLY